MVAPTPKQTLLKALREASKSPSYFCALLDDLLTPSEYEDLVKRWRIVSMLHDGIPQREIAKRLGVSLVKVTRGSQALRDPRGGFNQFFQRT